MFFVGAGKPRGVSQGITFNEVCRVIMLAWKLRVKCRICSTLEKQLRNLESFVIELRSRMENGSLPTYTGTVHRRASVHSGTPIQQNTGSFRVTVLRGNMEQRASRKRQSAHRCPAKIEFGEAAVYERRIGIQMPREKIQAAPQ